MCDLYTGAANTRVYMVITKHASEIRLSRGKTKRQMKERKHFELKILQLTIIIINNFLLTNVISFQLLKNQR